MSEPVAAVAAGIGAATVAVLGLEPQALVWGFVGASIGISTAPAAGRMRAIAVFLAVVLAAALLGSWAAEHFFEARGVARNAWCLLLGISFHPLMTVAVQNIPGVFEALLRRLGVKQ